MFKERIAGPRAKVTIRHERAYDYDEKRGVWLRRVESEEERWNLVTDAGRRQIHTYIYGDGTQRNILGSGLNYIALSNNGSAPDSGDTALTGELTDLGAPGLGRALSSVTLPTGSGTSTTLQNVFTYTGGSSQAVQKSALFDDASAGVMAHEVQFSARTLFTNDTLTITYTITIA